MSHAVTVYLCRMKTLLLQITNRKPIHLRHGSGSRFNSFKLFNIKLKMSS